MPEPGQEAGKTIQRGRRNRLSMYQNIWIIHANWYMVVPQHEEGRDKENLTVKIERGRDQACTKMTEKYM